MDEANIDFTETAAATKRFAQRLFLVGENRLQLLIVELQEERERLMRTMFLAAGAGVFGFLAALTLTATIVVLFWTISPVGVLVVLTVLYAVAAGCMYLRVTHILQNWKTLSATIEQLKKDRECLEKNLL